MGQRGTFSGDDLRGSAAHGRFSYALTAKPTAPRLRAEYNYASGDAAPGDGVRGTFDQLYPTNFDKYGIVDQIGYRNMHDARVGVTQKKHFTAWSVLLKMPCMICCGRRIRSPAVAT